MKRKGISQHVLKKLFVLSGNQCSFPGCTNSLYNIEEDILLVEICHIRAVSGKGPRYDTNYPKEEVDSVENLMLLCPNHHTIIDGNFEKYTIEALLHMKSEHERKNHELGSEHIGDNQISEINSKVHEILEAIDKLRLSIDQPIDQINPLPKKIAYPAPQNYIHRYVSPTRGDISEVGFESKSLSNLILEEKRLTILGVGGSGKSIELDHLAYLHSNQESDLFPVKIRLNILTTQDLDELLRLEFPELDQVPQSRLLILLDALDEVHSSYIDIASSKIEILSKKYRDSIIVVSCRNNFYITESNKRKAKLDGFSSYLIQPLDYASIYFYLQNKVGIPTEEFIFNIRKRKFYDLLYSPFFLVHIVEIFETKKEYPSSIKSVFEYLIQQRIEKDYEKYCNSGINIQDYSYRLSQEIKGLAIIAECLGRNYLDNKTEVQRLIRDFDFLEVIKRTFLFNKSNDESRWEFEHNNFQEFLAAQFLSELSFEEIQEFISFRPDFKKVKPAWLNTLSFLFSIIDQNDEKHDILIDWILDIEPDVLIRFEKDKIESRLREKLFREIYEDFESKQIIIRNEKFESEDLANFVSDSKKIIEFLIQRIKQSNDRLVITEAVRILHYFEQIGGYLIEIREEIKRIINSTDFSEEIKYECFNALYNLKINDDQLTDSILENNDLESNQYIRAGFYRYLEASNQPEKYTKIILRGIEILENVGVTVNGIPKREKPFLSDEKYIIKRLFDKINTSENVIPILKWACELDSPTSLHSEFFEFIKDLLVKAAEDHKNNHEIFDHVLELLRSFSRRYYKELGDSFRKFFLETSTVFKAFNCLYSEWMIDENGGFELTYGMAVICDEECICFIVSEIESGVFLEPKTWQFRNVLGMDGRKELHDLYHEELLKIDSEKYAFKKIDYKSIKKAKRKKDLELLFSKKEFLFEVVNVFKDENAKLTKDELYDWTKRAFNDDEMTNSLVVETLRDFARDKEYVELSEVKHFINNKSRWRWFQIHNLVQFARDTDDFEFPSEAFQFVLTWVEDELKTANFKTAIEYKNKNYYSYRYTELYISYFIQRFDIEVSPSVLLDLLNLECFLLPVKINTTNLKGDERVPDTFDFVAEKLGFEKVSQRVLDNLKNSFLVPVVRKSHIKFCHDFKVCEAAPMVLDEILNVNWEGYYQREFITKYIEMSSDLDLLLEIFEELPEESQIHASRLMAEEGYLEIVETLKNLILNGDDEDAKFGFIQNLKILDERVAFAFEKDWILRNKRIPERYGKSSNLKSAQIEDLIEIFEDAIKFKYGTGMWSSRNDFLSELIEKGSKDEISYLMIRDKIMKWLEEYEDVKFLHYQLQNLEQKYYSNIPQALTFEKAVQLVRKMQSPDL